MADVDNNTAPFGGLPAWVPYKDLGLSPTFFTIVIGLSALALLFRRASSTQFDDREPPLLRARVPGIGHLVGLLVHQTRYLKMLYEKRMPIATLPILNGKLYVVWDPALVQSAYRNRDLSFEPFALEFAQRGLALRDETDKVLRETDMVPEFFVVIHAALTGSSLHRMNANALKYVGEQLDAIGTGPDALDVPNLFAWVKRVMTLAATEGLFGAENPIRKDMSLIDELWAYERGLPMLLLNVMPYLTTRKAYLARARLQNGLSDFYAAGHDHNDDVAQIVKDRLAVLRRYGISDHDEVGRFELGLVHAGTLNTMPVFFWLMAHIFTRPELVSRLREEVLQASSRRRGEDGADELVVDITAFDKECPLLVSCYRETLRILSRSVSYRMVIKDTTISDGKGNDYVLKKGVNLQIPAEVLHSLENVWGDDAAEFVPDRFVAADSDGDKEVTAGARSRAKRSSYIPFGGGRHLCPGRNFAFAENLGFVSALLTGFEVLPLDGDMAAFKPPAGTLCSAAEATPKPVNNGEGFGVRIQRRKGWEGTKWRFVC